VNIVGAMSSDDEKKRKLSDAEDGEDEEVNTNEPASSKASEDEGSEKVCKVYLPNKYAL
jgi:hypothetical protein